jgi:ribosomal protein S18 acetylase RimI-like enzyme
MSDNLGDYFQRYALSAEERNAGVTQIVKSLFWELGGPHQRIKFFQDFGVVNWCSDGACEHVAGFLPADSCAPILKLSVEDSADMLELMAMTKPGPFGPRTHELGSFFGIRIGRNLAAMAGERLRVDGYTEVGAVCTHPHHLGKGYAAALMRTVMRGILEHGETPFLHSRADNPRAIALYERLGVRRPVISSSLGGNEGCGRAPRLKLPYKLMPILVAGALEFWPENIFLETVSDMGRYRGAF